MLSWLRQGTRWEKCNLNRNRLHHNHDHHFYLHSCFSGGGGGWHHAWQHGKGGLDFGDDGDNDDIDEVDVDVQQRSWWNQWCWWRWWRGRGSWGSWRWGPRHCNRDQNSFRWWWSSDQWCTTIENHCYQWLLPTIPFNGDGTPENHFSIVALSSLSSWFSWMRLTVSTPLSLWTEDTESLNRGGAMMTSEKYLNSKWQCKVERTWQN